LLGLRHGDSEGLAGSAFRPGGDPDEQFMDPNSRALRDHAAAYLGANAFQFGDRLPCRRAVEPAHGRFFGDASCLPETEHEDPVVGALNERSQALRGHWIDDFDAIAPFRSARRVKMLAHRHLEEGALVVVVHDCGAGIMPGRRSANAGLGLGLRLIDKLADSAEVSSRAGHGTRVEMRFAVRNVTGVT
jgi:histidine kinase-like protein